MLSEIEIDELVNRAADEVHEISQGAWTFVSFRRGVTLRRAGRIGVQIDGHLVADQLRAMADVLDQAEEEMKR